MPALNPIPQQLPKDLPSKGWFTTLTKAIYQMWYAIGGQGNAPTMLDLEDTPTTDPGWATSDSAPMNPPDGYVRINVAGSDKVLPYWNT